MDDSAPGYRFRLSAALAVAVVLWLLHLLPFALPHARLWGVNHLLFLPPAWAYGYFAGGVLILLLILIPGIRNVASRSYASLAASLLEHRPRTKLILFTILAAAVFWIFRTPIKLLGDSQAVIANIGNGIPVVLKWSETASVYIVHAVSTLVPVSGSDRGQYAYEIVSVLSGALTILFAGGIAHELAETAVRRLFILAMTLFAGWIVLFFGYAENYPLTWIFMTAYIYYGIRYIKGRSRLVWPTIFLLAAIPIHAQALFFALSYPVLLFSRGRARQFYARRKKTVWAAAVFLTLAGVAVFVLKYVNSLQFSLMVIPFFKGHPMMPGYWMFSPAHIMDIVGEFLLVAPLLPVLMILGWKPSRTIIADTCGLFLGALGIGGLIFILLIDPKLGMARDWDLFALVGLPWVLLFAGNVAPTEDKHPGVYAAVILAAGLMLIPWVATNLRFQPSIDYFKFALNLDLPRSRSGIIVLRQMYLAGGDSLTADSLGRAVDREFPSIHLCRDADELIQRGQLDKAKILIDSLELFDPTMFEFLTLRGYWNLERRDYNAALEDFKQVATLQEGNVMAEMNLANVYFILRRFEPMMAALRRGQKYDPHSDKILAGLAAAFSTMKEYDSAGVYATRLMELYPDEPDAYYFTGMTAFYAGRVEVARSHLKRYLQMAPNGPYAGSANEALEKLK